MIVSGAIFMQMCINTVKKIIERRKVPQEPELQLSNSIVPANNAELCKIDSPRVSKNNFWNIIGAFVLLSYGFRRPEAVMAVQEHRTATPAESVSAHYVVDLETDPLDQDNLSTDSRVNNEESGDNTSDIEDIELKRLSLQRYVEAAQRYQRSRIQYLATVAQVSPRVEFLVNVVFIALLMLILLIAFVITYFATHQKEG